MSTPIALALECINSEYQTAYQQQYGTLPSSADLVGVASPCIQQSQDNQVLWQAVVREELADFSNLERGIELTLHSDIKAFYGSQYSANLTVSWNKKPLTLLQVWSDDDFTLLQENILGHLVTQRRLKLKPTVFIAAIDSDIDVISICNISGEVILEQLGTDKREVLSDNIEKFLSELKAEV
ncbi:SecY-interacting protein [Vibrio gallicus]|uniref:SecY-interacting protein n=1 Tax=Vibrio gallicus TaxID=190897 RepID=UPI0021C3A247|nr:SecY-interacting protein [Vibrio gallicus]